MTMLFLAAGLPVAVAAAARSTWSPCGLSMLSTITPFGERRRGHRFGVTAAWFLAGAVVGGAALGGLAALLAMAASALGAGSHPTVPLALGAVVAVAGAAIDAGVFGDVLPLLRRQVDDGWLARYRPWFYAAGFGLQIGVGFATYLMTMAVVLVVVLAALGASPLAALVLGAVFGLARGSTVFLVAGATTPARLRELHLRLDRLAGPVRAAAAGVQAGAAVALALGAAGVSSSPLAAIAVVAGAALSVALVTAAVVTSVVPAPAVDVGGGPS
jgi:MFS family permease